MQLTITQKEEKEIDLTGDHFWKDKQSQRFRAIIGGHTFYSVSIIGDYYARVWSDRVEDNKSEISEACSSWLTATEEEFISFYNDARFKTSLKPHLISKEAEAEIN